ncbi:MAG: Gfo/Idh/MocA family oxidoreductase [Pirellulales bacterium]|nr:Gfo/Idh/MocA family oxidoreductase [Pirellulales bacterium]
MIRLAVVGCGGAAWIGHLPWIWERPEVELTATCALDEVTARQAAQRWNGKSWYVDYGEMLSRERLDAVVIATPPDTHAELALSALERGLHVLIEKPMARTVAECDALIVAAERCGAILTVGHEKRFNPGFEAIKRIIEDGTLGHVFYLVVHWSAAVRLDPDRLCPPDYRTSYEWRWTSPSAGGGILADHLPHYLDLWRWWTDAELESIDVQLLNVRKDLIGDQLLGGPHEDFAVALMKFTNGCVGVFESGNVGRGLSPILHIGSGVGEWSEYGMIYGTRGHLVFDLLPWDSPEMPRIMMYSLEEKRPSYRGWFQVELPDPYRAPGGPLSPRSNPHYQFKRQMDHFIDCIANNAAPRVTAWDGRATVAAVEAAYRSRDEGGRVTLSAPLRALV